MILLLQWIQLKILYVNYSVQYKVQKKNYQDTSQICLKYRLLRFYYLKK